mmetsp:Transcript_29759/g.48115  ORF Transcript_29759/g.48115 Transcript_29759/m.48115 type:complete len:312 (+) Transcript_29759:488-1423(+)
MNKGLRQHDQHGLDTFSGQGKFQADRHFCPLSWLRLRPEEVWPRHWDGHNGLTLNGVRGIHHVVVQISDDNAKSIGSWCFRRQIHEQSKGILIPGERCVHNDLQGVIDAVWLSTRQANLLEGTLRGAGEDEAGRGHDVDLVPGIHVQGKGEHNLRLLHCGNSWVHHVGGGHLRYKEAGTFAPTNSCTSTLTTSFHVPSDAARCLLRCQHTDLDSLELCQWLSRGRGDGRSLSVRRKGLARQTHVTTATSTVIEAEFWRCHNDQLPNDRIADINVQDDIHDCPGWTSNGLHSKHELLHWREAVQLAIVGVGG